MLNINYPKFFDEIRELQAILNKLNIPKNAQADALYKHIDRAVNRVEYKAPRGLYERLKEGETVKFWTEKSPDTITEIVPSDTPWDVQEEILTINSLYDCTGQKFTIWIRQSYCKPIKKYLLIHHLGYDV